MTQLSPTLPAAWACADPESGLRALTWALGTCPGCRDVVGTTPTALHSGDVAAAALEAGTAWGAPLNGRSYYLTLTATNNAGVTVVFGAPAVHVDTSPPVVTGLLVDGRTTPASPHVFVSAYGGVRVAWRAADAESGVAQQRLCARVGVPVSGGGSDSDAPSETVGSSASGSAFEVDGSGAGVAPAAPQEVCVDVEPLASSHTFPAFATAG
jgi:hypothetical protein